ncbi:MULTISPECIES: metallophosphoesterase [unclassified Myroides]|uniref:metallophosphoesterase n=1 Tax=unclassified Myroides TaxID=2642485 RepID=UPI003D2F6975
MKLFSQKPDNRVKIKPLAYFVLLIFTYSCATWSPQQREQHSSHAAVERKNNDKIVHTYYFTGGLLAANSTEEQAHLEELTQVFKKADQTSTLVLLGDNIQKKQLKNKEDRQLNTAVSWAKQFPGETVFINGETEWKKGYEGIKDISKYLTANLEDKKALLPRKVCGFERLKINDQTVLIVVDSQWYLENWDLQPNMNEDCDIKTRDDFFDELRGEINKNQNRIVVLALHHPVYSTGNHGGYFSLQDHLYPFEAKVPLPVIGSLINYTRSVSGIQTQDLQSKKYNALNKRLQTMAQMYENVVFVSGHERNLQYHEKDGVKQIVSGALGNLSPARAIEQGSFSAGQLGYATLAIAEDKSAVLGFYTFQNGAYQRAWQQQVFQPEAASIHAFGAPAMDSIHASVYPKEWTKKSGFYRFLWGEHYRSTYAQPIAVAVANLDTVKGGLTPLISGGGNQSLSLRLQDKRGTQYVMRGVRKSVSRFLQTAVFRDNYVMESFDDTWAERFIYDFYTTAHPYTPFIIGDLSKKVGIYHTNPELYYIPKQQALGAFNDKYGDELYMIEERPSEGHEEESFGNATKIISTTDVIANLRKDEKYAVDEQMYLRARIFDLLIGDWDRHGDQWRWSEFKEGDKVIYRPVPRDRDQAFAKIDGALLSLIKKLPMLRHMQNYTEDFANPRWINHTAFPLDQYLLKSTTEEDWIAQATSVVGDLDDESIDQIFAKLPKEIQGEDVEHIKYVLKARKKKIVDFVPQYYRELRKYVVLSGTDKKDVFKLLRNDDGSVELTQLRDKKAGQETVFEKTYDPRETKEIWIYGLNDEDTFIVEGSKKAKIKLRLIGGKNKDTFQLDQPKHVVVYDYADKQNELIEGSKKAKHYFTNHYDLNNFNYEKLPLTVNMLLPNVGYNPEDGVKLGFLYSSKRLKFVQDPYAAQHTLKGFYSFNTQGVEAEYAGHFPNATNNWGFTLNARATSPNFAVNYYGIGNETHYFDKEMGDEYKRVRIESYTVAPGYKFDGKNGDSFEVNVEYKAMKVQDKANRFITSSSNLVDQKVFDFQQYATLQATYDFQQYNNTANPSKGFAFHATMGWRTNLGDSKQNFPFLDAKVSFAHYLERSERLILATNFTYQTRFNSNYDFYHGSTIGGNTNLRGFRPERFTGKTSFVQTTDLRFNAGEFTAGFIPMSYGVYAGFDYGRVWTPQESSSKWHNAYGAGLWVNAIEQATLHCSYFYSKDGGRFVFGLGFGF